MPGWQLTGRVVAGQSKGAGFVGLPWVRAQLVGQFGIDPFPGTLNLRVEPAVVSQAWKEALERASVFLPGQDASGCAGRCLAVRIGGFTPGVIIVPNVPGYPADQLEVVAALNLRQHLRLRDGDQLEIASADLQAVRAVVFDVDGTLVNSIAGMHLAASRAAALYGYVVPADAVKRALNYGESLWHRIMPTDRQGDRELAMVLRMETMRHWPRVLEEAVEVFPRLAHTLGMLEDAGFRLAIYTGSRGESFAPLKRAGLLQYFDPIITAGDVSRPKPHPEGLLKCLELMGCSAADAVYVGDTRHDMEAGRAAGMRSIGVLSGAADSAILSEAGADHLVESHEGLLALLLAHRLER